MRYRIVKCFGDGLKDYAFYTEDIGKPLPLMVSNQIGSPLDYR